MITKIIPIICLLIALTTAIEVQVEKNKKVNVTLTSKKSEKRDASLISSSNKNLGYNYLQSSHSGYSSEGLLGHGSSFGGSSGHELDSYSLHGSTPSIAYGTPLGAPWDEQMYLSSAHGGSSLNSYNDLDSSLLHGGYNSYSGAHGISSSLGSHESLGSSIGSYGSSIGSHGISLGSHGSSLGSYGSSLGSHGSSIGSHSGSLGSYGGSHGISSSSFGSHGSSLSSLGSHGVSNIYGTPGFSSHGISNTYGTPSYSSHGISNTYGTPSISSYKPSFGSYSLSSHGTSSSLGKPSISSHGISSSYGTPTYATHGIFSSHGSPGYASLASYKPSLTSHIVGLSHGDQTPVYAIGHKGLRHYTSITGSIPSHSSSGSSYSSGHHSNSLGSLSGSGGYFSGYKGSSAAYKAPTHTVVISKPKTATPAFKPSVYLGSITSDDHSGLSHSSIGSTLGHSSGYSYSAPKYQSTISYVSPQKSYLPPTSSSYHTSPSTSYGVPSISTGSHHGYSGEASSSTYHH